MVLRDARVYEMVDSRYRRYLVTRSVSDHHSLPALLQLSRRLRQEPGMRPCSQHVQKAISRKENFDTDDDEDVSSGGYSPHSFTSALCP